VSVISPLLVINFDQVEARKADNAEKEENLGTGADALESICGWISIVLLALSALFICANVSR